MKLTDQQLAEAQAFIQSGSEQLPEKPVARYVIERGFNGYALMTLLKPIEVGTELYLAPQQNHCTLSAAIAEAVSTGRHERLLAFRNWILVTGAVHPSTSWYAELESIVAGDFEPVTDAAISAKEAT